MADDKARDYAKTANDFYVIKPWEHTNKVSSEVTGSLELDIEPKKALHLFTAEGERPWVPDWNPAILKGTGYNAGDVFSAPLGTFYVVKFDVDSQSLFYTYVSPIEASSIEINIDENSNGGSIVNVTWKSTSLTEQNDATIKAFNQKAMAERMAAWKALIQANKDKVQQFLDTIPA